jgi:hypothetical protein
MNTNDDVSEFFEKMRQKTIKRASQFPALEEADLLQAFRWVRYRLPPLKRQHENILGIHDYNSDFCNLGQITSESHSDTEAATDLLTLLSTEKISAYAHEGRWSNKSDNWNYWLEGPEEVPSDCWNSIHDLIEGKLDHYTGQYWDIYISFADLKNCFPSAEELNGELQQKTPSPEKTKLGRPPVCAKEDWLERFAVLTLNNKINLGDSQDAIAQTLVEDLNKQGIQVKVNTVKKDWIGPIIRKAKIENK